MIGRDHFRPYDQCCLVFFTIFFTRTVHEIIIIGTTAEELPSLRREQERADELRKERLEPTNAGGELTLRSDQQ